MSRMKQAMIERGEFDIEDDGFYTVNFDERAYDSAKERTGPLPAPLDPIVGCVGKGGAGLLLLSGVYALDGTRLD